MQTITYAPSHDTDSVTSRPCGLAALAAEGWPPLTPGGPQVGGSRGKGPSHLRQRHRHSPGDAQTLGENGLSLHTTPSLLPSPAQSQTGLRFLAHVTQSVLPPKCKRVA